MFATFAALIVVVIVAGVLAFAIIADFIGERRTGSAAS
jgi:hypothetical protein